MIRKWSIKITIGSVSGVVHMRWLMDLWSINHSFCLPDSLVYQMVTRANICNILWLNDWQRSYDQWRYAWPVLKDTDTAEHSSKNVNESIKLLSELGFTIKYEKSVLIHALSIKFSGFIIDSNTMTSRTTSDKRSKLKDMAQSLLNNKIPTVYNLAR